MFDGFLLTHMYTDIYIDMYTRITNLYKCLVLVGCLHMHTYTDIYINRFTHHKPVQVSRARGLPSYAHVHRHIHRYVYTHLKPCLVLDGCLHIHTYTDIYIDMYTRITNLDKCLVLVDCLHMYTYTDIYIDMYTRITNLYKCLVLVGCLHLHTYTDIYINRYTHHKPGQVPRARGLPFCLRTSSQVCTICTHPYVYVCMST